MSEIDFTVFCPERNSANGRGRLYRNPNNFKKVFLALTELGDWHTAGEISMKANSIKVGGHCKELNSTNTAMILNRLTDHGLVKKQYMTHGGCKDRKVYSVVGE